MKENKEKEEDISELEEEVVREIEKDSFREIGSDFTQEAGGVVEDENKIDKFISTPFSAGDFSPSLEKIQDIPQRTEFEPESLSTKEDQESQKMYGIVTEEEKRLYESRSRSMDPPVLNPTKMTQRTQFIDPLAGRNIQTQNDMEPEMIRTQTRQERQRLPFEKEDNKYKEVKL